MTILSFIGLILGTGLFIAGMNLLSSGLKRSGGRLKSALKKSTSNTLRGVLAGAALTAAVQSSSAVTVMLTGLADADLILPEECFGVIAGANIGTTVTAWILTFGQALPLSAEALFPLGIIPGIILLFGNDKKKSIGRAVIGFSTIMLAMALMKNSAAPVARNESFSNLLTAYDSPVLCVLTGALFTAVIQSSSASTGILQALSISADIPLKTAVPIISGQNIGTCATAVLSAAGTGKNAKRAALLHIMFNVFGTIIFLPLFFGIDFIFKPGFFSGAAAPADIAAVHTAFNIISAAVLLPFKKLIIKLTQKAVR